MESKKNPILEINTAHLDSENITDQQKAALALLETALTALVDAELFLHASEETLIVDNSEYYSPWDHIAKIDTWHYRKLYSYHLSQEQEELKNTLAGLKKLLGKDDD